MDRLTTASFVSVENEKTTIIANENNEKNFEFKGIRLVGLSKTYRKHLWKSSGDVNALQNAYIQIKDNECLGLLGHNGAGKTTLIGILTGLLDPTQGYARIFDCLVHKDTFQIQKLRSIIGFCPQHDILWEELTAYEHLWVFAKIKNQDIRKVELNQKISDLLTQVGLSHVANKKTRTFSGGMKRRLSVAISCIGDPKVLFLDEPTTGMDPKQKRQVWELIQELKKDRTVILTTHSMEEADVLSDRIAIIASGQVQCIGTSLTLKNTICKFYRFHLVTQPEKVDVLIKEVKAQMPSVKVLDQNAGSVIFILPQEQLEKGIQFCQILENNEKKELKNLVMEWTFSNATLEDVFITVNNNFSGKSNQGELQQ